jgi:DNA repair protein RadC
MLFETTTSAPISQLANPDLVRLVAGERAVEAYQAAGTLCALFDSVAAAPKRSSSSQRRLQAARELITRSLREQLSKRDVLAAPAMVRDYLRLRIGALEHEEFWCFFMDAQNRLMVAESLFRGSQTNVYPREVVKRALQLNCASIVVAHNHPSGLPEPSEADRLLTKRLKEVLALVDVMLLDHFVVTVAASVSFAERGLL